MLLGAGHEAGEIFESLLGASASCRFPRERSQFVEHGLEPDTGDAGLGESGQVARRVGIGLGLEQRITIEGKIGIAELQRRAWIQGMCRGPGRFGELLDEVEERLTGLTDSIGESFAQDAGDGRFAVACCGVRGLVAQGLALGFEVAELDEEEIIFTEGVGQLLGGPAEQIEQLNVGQ